MKGKRRKKREAQLTFYCVVFICVGLFALAATYHPSLFAYKTEFRVEENKDQIRGVPAVGGIEKEKTSRSAHVKTPEAVKAIYMTSCVVGTESFRDKLVGIIDRTEVNSVIIDVKDYTGTLSFIPEDEELMPLWQDARCGTSDMKDFIQLLHEKGVYVIARITVFQDPYYAEKHPDQAVLRASDGQVWKDGKGLSFIDVSAKPAWDYTIAIAKEAYAIGFDELNFDYVRFPSDGNMKDISFPHSKDKNKADALESFFSYLDTELHKEIPEAVTSVDIFGMTTTNYDDLGIGQVLEKALPYFDYVAPMVYPSHYPAGFNGWDNPNTVPGPLIRYVMDAAVRRTIANVSPIQTIGSKRIECKIVESEEAEDVVGQNIEAEIVEEKPLPPECIQTLYTKEVYDKNKIRPWLQDFSYGGTYDAAAVRAQIDSTYGAGLNSWMLWDPGNTYTEEALLPR